MWPWADSLVILGVHPHLHCCRMHHEAHDSVEHAGTAPPTTKNIM